jgi:hypothetical protein
MTDPNGARERWQATLQALNARKPYAEHGATPLQYLTAMRREDTTAKGSRPYVLAADGANLDLFDKIAGTIGTEIGRRRWATAYAEHLLDVAGAAADEAQRRYDQSDPDEATQYEPAFAEGAQFVLEALLHSMETDPSGARPTVNRIEARGAIDVPREARNEQ